MSCSLRRVIALEFQVKLSILMPVYNEQAHIANRGQAGVGRDLPPARSSS